MIICIHHTDMDGMLAAYIVKRKYPEAELIAMNYNDPTPEIPKDATVIIVDFSLPVADMVRIAKNNPLTWIDHHEKAIKQVVAELDGQLLPDYRAKLVVGVAACQLTWEFYHPEEKIPLAVDLAAHYDVWKKSGRYDWKKEILPFHYGMSAVATRVEDLLTHFPTLADINVATVLQGGEFIYTYQRLRDQRVAASAFEATFKEGTAICLNTIHMSSEGFEAVLNSEKHDFMLAFRFDGARQLWLFSVRTYKEDFDCAAFAALYGGGGHRKASGFLVANLGSVFNNLEFKANDNRATRRRKQAKKGD